MHKFNTAIFLGSGALHTSSSNIPVLDQNIAQLETPFNVLASVDPLSKEQPAPSCSGLLLLLLSIFNNTSYVFIYLCFVILRRQNFRAQCGIARLEVVCGVALVK